MDNKPNVFPTGEQSQTNANALTQGLPVQTNDPIGDSANVSNGELDAAEQMRRNTAEELALRAHAEERTASSVADGIAARAALMKEMEMN